MSGCTKTAAIVALLAFPTIWGCGVGYTIYAEDVVISPGQSSRFSAFVESRLNHGNVVNTPVRFIRDGKIVGEANTDSDGQASIILQNQNGSGTYQVQATVDDQQLIATGDIYHWDRERTILAVDLDETISQTSYSQLFFTEMADQSPVVKDSPAVLRQIQDNYHLLYISARPRWLHAKTKRWLERERFPKGPILHAARFEACWRQEYYKRLMLAEFKSRHPNLLIGIGDKSVDERAYGDNGMLAVILGNNPNRYGTHCVVLPSWREVGQFLNRHRDTLIRSGALARVFREHEANLRAFFEAPAATALALADENRLRPRPFRAPSARQVVRNRPNRMSSVAR